MLYLQKKGESGAEVSDILTHCEYSGRRALQDDIRLLRDEYRAEITYKRSRPPRYCLVDAGELLLSLKFDVNEVARWILSCSPNIKVLNFAEWSALWLRESYSGELHKCF